MVRIGLASSDNASWLQARGILAVAYGNGQEDRINTVVAYQAAKDKGVKARGTANAGGAVGLRELTALAATGSLARPGRCPYT